MLKFEKLKIMIIMQIISLFIILLSNNAFGQHQFENSIQDIEFDSTYSEISFKFYPYDSDGNYLSGLTKSDIEVELNERNLDVISLEEANEKSEKPTSLVITFDKRFHNNGEFINGRNKKSLIKMLNYVVDEFLSNNKDSEIAIWGIGKHQDIISNFTNSKDKLKENIQNINVEYYRQSNPKVYLGFDVNHNFLDYAIKFKRNNRLSLLHISSYVNYGYPRVEYLNRDDIISSASIFCFNENRTPHYFKFYNNKIKLRSFQIDKLTDLEVGLNGAVRNSQYNNHYKVIVSNCNSIHDAKIFKKYSLITRVKGLEYKYLSGISFKKSLTPSQYIYKYEKLDKSDTINQTIELSNSFNEDKKVYASIDNPKFILNKNEFEIKKRKKDSLKFSYIHRDTTTQKAKITLKVDTCEYYIDIVALHNYSNLVGGTKKSNFDKTLLSRNKTQSKSSKDKNSNNLSSARQNYFQFFDTKTNLKNNIEIDSFKTIKIDSNYNSISTYSDTIVIDANYHEEFDTIFTLFKNNFNYDVEINFPTKLNDYRDFDILNLIYTTVPSGKDAEVLISFRGIYLRSDTYNINVVTYREKEALDTLNYLIKFKNYKKENKIKLKFFRHIGVFNQNEELYDFSFPFDKLLIQLQLDYYDSGFDYLDSIYLSSDSKIFDLVNQNELLFVDSTDLMKKELKFNLNISDTGMYQERVVFEFNNDTKVFYDFIWEVKKNKDIILKLDSIAEIKDDNISFAYSLNFDDEDFKHFKSLYYYTQYDTTNLHFILNDHFEGFGLSKDTALFIRSIILSYFEPYKFTTKKDKKVFTFRLLNDSLKTFDIKISKFETIPKLINSNIEYLDNEMTLNQEDPNLDQDSIEQNSDLKIYNFNNVISDEKIKFTLSSNESSNIIIKLIESTSRSSILYNGEISKGESEHSFDVSEFPPGFYFLTINADNQTKVKKLIILK